MTVGLGGKENTNTEFDIVIIGLGPAGIGAAHRFSELSANQEVACFEMGPRPQERSCPILQDRGCLRKNKCQILTGFGGSSLLSGGKLSTLPAGDSLEKITNDREAVEEAINEGLDWFSRFLDVRSPDIDEETIQEAKSWFSCHGFQFDYYDSHLITNGKDGLIQGYSQMLDRLTDSGIGFHFQSSVTNISQARDSFRFSVKGADEIFCANRIIFAAGLPGKELVDRLHSELDISGKESKLELGVRLEFPSNLYPGIDEPHNDLKLHFNNCRTFCVCKGGQLAPYFHDGVSLLDGHVDRTNLTELTNLGLRLRVSPSAKNGEVYEIVRRRYLDATKGVPLRQSYLSYISNSNPRIVKPMRSSIDYWRKGDINEVFPDDYSAQLRANVCQFVGTVLPENSHDQISVYAPGLYYPSYEFNLRPDFSASPGFHVVGESTGQFRGILQAFASGLLCADAIIEDMHGG